MLDHQGEKSQFSFINSSISCLKIIINNTPDNLDATHNSVSVEVPNFFHGEIPEGTPLHGLYMVENDIRDHLRKSILPLRGRQSLGEIKRSLSAALAELNAQK